MSQSKARCCCAAVLEVWKGGGRALGDAGGKQEGRGEQAKGRKDTSMRHSRQGKK